MYGLNHPFMSKKESLMKEKKLRADSVRNQLFRVKLSTKEEKIKGQIYTTDKIKKHMNLESDLAFLKQSRPSPMPVLPSYSFQLNNFKQKESFLKPKEPIHNKKPTEIQNSNSSKPKDQNLKEKFLPKNKSLDWKNKQPIAMKQKRSASLIKVEDNNISTSISIPSSILKKVNRIQPPTIPKTMKDGGVLSVHMLTDRSPIYDPPIKTDIAIGKKELDGLLSKHKINSYREIIDGLQEQFKEENQRKNKSASVTDKRYLKLKLPTPQDLSRIKGKGTPKSKIQSYSYRDFPINDTSSEEKEKMWVQVRRNQYAAKVKKNLPVELSEKKKIQLELLKERLKFYKPTSTKKIKLDKLS